MLHKTIAVYNAMQVIEKVLDILLEIPSGILQTRPQSINCKANR